MTPIPKPKKRKRSARKGLVKRLDDALSVLVRTQTPYCVICGTSDRLTAGHVFTRANYATRWDFRNVFTQCVGCNMRHEYDPIPFYNWFQTKFGKKAFNDLYFDWNQTTKLSNAELEVKLEEIRERTRTTTEETP